MVLFWTWTFTVCRHPRGKKMLQRFVQIKSLNTSALLMVLSPLKCQTGDLSSWRTTDGKTPTHNASSNMTMTSLTHTNRSSSFHTKSARFNRCPFHSMQASKMKPARHGVPFGTLISSKLSKTTTSSKDGTMKRWLPTINQVTLIYGLTTSLQRLRLHQPHGKSKKRILSFFTWGLRSWKSFKRLYNHLCYPRCRYEMDLLSSQLNPTVPYYASRFEIEVSTYSVISSTEAFTLIITNSNDKEFSTNHSFKQS